MLAQERVNFYVFVNFPMFFMLLFLFHSIIVRKDSWNNFKFFKFLNTFLWHSMWSILENVPSALEKIVFFVLIGWNILYMSVMSLWSIVLFQSTAFMSDVLSIIESVMLNSHTVIVLLSISPFRYVNVSHIYLIAFIISAYIIMETVSQDLRLVVEIHIPVSVNPYPFSLFLAASRRSTCVKSSGFWVM